MQKIRSVGVTVVGIIILLFPIIAMVIINTIAKLYTGDTIWNSHEFIKSSWFSLLFFAILSIGVLKLNNKFRLLTVAITTAMAVGGPLGLTIGSFVTKPEVRSKIIEHYGISAVIYPWMIVIPVCLLYASIAFYLTRPKVKRQFTGAES